MGLESVSADNQVRQLHALLVRELQMAPPAPLVDAVTMLDESAKLSFVRVQGAGKARAARQAIARDIALGKRAFDEHALAEFDEYSWWVADLDAPGATNPAAALAEQVVKLAKQEAGALMASCAGAVFEQLSKEAAQVVKQLEELPPPPKHIFSDPDPGRLLANSADHRETLSVVLYAGLRHGTVQRASSYVRDLAGMGFHAFPDGAPRIAGEFRNWRKALDANTDLQTTHRHVRLWRTVVEGWEPGLWRPQDIAELKPEEQRFGAMLSRLGSAVGVNK